MSGHRRRAGLRDVGRRLSALEVEVGRFAAPLYRWPFDQHVGEDRDRVAALDDPMDVAERFEQDRAFDRDLHRNTSDYFLCARHAAGGRTLPRRDRKRKTARGQSEVDFVGGRLAGLSLTDLLGVTETFTSP